MHKARWQKWSQEFSARKTQVSGCNVKRTNPEGRRVQLSSDKVMMGGCLFPSPAARKGQAGTRRKLARLAGPADTRLLSMTGKEKRVGTGK